MKSMCRSRGPAGPPSASPAQTVAAVLSLLSFLAVPAGAMLPKQEIPAGVYRPGDTGNAFVVLRVADIDELWDFVGLWEGAGARFPHVYPPDVLIGDVPRAIEEDLRRDPRVIDVYRRTSLPAPSKVASDRRPLLDSWVREPDEEQTEPGKFPAEFGDLLLGPAFRPEEASPGKAEGGLVRKYGGAFGATMMQTSELILGKTAVAVVLPKGPESSYSDPEVAAVYGKVRGAMDFWAGHVGFPGARFVYDLRPNIPTTRNFHTTIPSSNSKQWIDELMEYLGYDLYLKGTDFGPVYEYMDSLRVRMRSEWAVCFFIPKVSYFAGAPYTAYAYLGGPFLVVPSGINGRVTPHGTGSMDLAHLIIHESGHLFWALDEYPAGGTSQPCHMISGYLAIPNSNSLNRDYTCDPAHVPCCMDTPGPSVCAYTLGQAGSWDDDDDNIPDVLDTHPFVYADSLGDTINTVLPEIRGVAAEIPVPNQAFGAGTGAAKLAGVAGTRANITFNSIEHLIYRIDEMVDEDDEPLWLYADPEGGWGGDSTRVSYTFVPDSLTGGLHTIRIRAVNTVGNQSTWGENRQTVFVKAIALRDFSAAPDYDGRVRISYRIRGGAFGATAILYRRDSEGVDEVVGTYSLADESPMVLYDGEPKPGERYRYRLVASALGSSWEWEAEVTGPARITRGDHLSLVTPNPFRATTMLSIYVPRGDLSDRPGGGGNPKPGDTPPNPYNPNAGAPQFTTETHGRYLAVRVEMDVFDLSGRLVRHFRPIHAYQGFWSEPFVWDGKDDSGEDVAQGVYFVRMKAGDDIRETRKVLLIR